MVFHQLFYFSLVMIFVSMPSLETVRHHCLVSMPSLIIVPHLFLFFIGNVGHFFYLNKTLQILKYKKLLLTFLYFSSATYVCQHAIPHQTWHTLSTFW